MVERPLRDVPTHELRLELALRETYAGALRYEERADLLARMYRKPGEPPYSIERPDATVYAELDAYRRMADRISQRLRDSGRSHLLTGRLPAMIEALLTDGLKPTEWAEQPSPETRALYEYLGWHWQFKIGEQVYTLSWEGTPVDRGVTGWRRVPPGWNLRETGNEG
jgi:hypothetical protein